MHIEELIIKNFRSFDEQGQSTYLRDDLITLIGANGTGKTVVMLALQRLFGVSGEQRQIRRQDFHIPFNESEPVKERQFTIEAIIAFPELDDEDGDHSAVPDFFSQMCIADEDGKLKCRFRLDAEWEDDSTSDGYITSQFRAVTTFDENLQDDDYKNVKGSDRSRIQLIYIPAIRSANIQVANFLKSRLWKAINWSESVKDSFATKAQELNTSFDNEKAIDTVKKCLTSRWTELYSGGTDSSPKFQPVDMRFEEFVRKVEVLLHPTEDGRDRSIAELSDGQSSLFHIAMTSATLDIESQLINMEPAEFNIENMNLASLTILAIEEPENNLAPFYLSRIVEQVLELTKNTRSQAILSSHSSSILSRIEPAQVRHFRLQQSVSKVNPLSLPNDETDEAKYVQQAVKAYPELYFAKFVILGEGASEEVILPRLSKAMDLEIDRSFVAMVPLGGRHVNHFWRLLNDLDIPHATLLDLDWGRHGGGKGRIKNAIKNLIEFGTAPDQLFQNPTGPNGYEDSLAYLDSTNLDKLEDLSQWIKCLQRKNVFFSAPLDIDYSMFKAFPDVYKKSLDDNSTGPSNRGEPKKAVLGDDGYHDWYDDDELDSLRWYRYLFLGRGKPSTHIQVLNKIDNKTLSDSAPEELKDLVRCVNRYLV
ncbi:chromosome segregation protein SMC [Vibrio sp. MACH09]|uniref:ATP-dependent nuclease n=1 Tax=Vibrio sp. MACH09 TaxID=3025122 RepID=UPI002793091F|nr:AAA family ATPase [Vibrio sp. MACH09]GLO60109.1 chromosome segregation protein SMC [Vibrio sp. MACH09]